MKKIKLNQYTKSGEVFRRNQKKINLDFEEEAKDVTENINELNNKSNEVNNEIEELKKK